MNIDWEKIKKAVDAIDDGLGNQIDLKDHSIVVYSVGEKVIRIDIKK